MLKIAFHLAFTATLSSGELLGLTWDDMDISEEAIADNKAYVIINKQVESIKGCNRSTQFKRNYHNISKPEEK